LASTATTLAASDGERPGSRGLGHRQNQPWQLIRLSTDDQGPHVVPDLRKRPTASGPGLVDSPRWRRAGSGEPVRHARAQPARPPILPGELLVRALNLPDRANFPAPVHGNGIAPAMQSPSGSTTSRRADAPYHQLGNKATVDRKAWARSIPRWPRGCAPQSGIVAAPTCMLHRPLRGSASWRCSRTGPIASPPAITPARPPRTDLERNIVITSDWADPRPSISMTRWRASSQPGRQRERSVFGVAK
jgi:hypothetical protein